MPELNTDALRTRLPAEIARELDAFRERIVEYLDGIISPDEFKACRLQLGLYGIRGLRDKQMLRIKVPAGQLTADQLDQVACAARDYATGRAHVTTRQDLQLYEIRIERAPELLRALAAVGLTSREACGNSVRNVTGCSFAGLCPDELFDATPYALAITRHFLRHPDTQQLPRKFKISVSGCTSDCAMAPIHDLGAVAARDGSNGQTAYGFRLFVGGGLGAAPRAADVLEPFTPIALLLPTCEAITRVFNQHGERKNRQRARLKFLLERIGLAEFQRLVFAERDALLRTPDRFPVLPLPALTEASVSGAAELPHVGASALRRWLATNARPQRQSGYWVVTVRLPLGDLSVQQMHGLAAVSRWCGRGQFIITPWQDLCLPWVASEHLERLYDQLAELGLAQAEAERIQDITACPGADTCQIGVTSSRGLASVVSELLDRPEYKTEDLAGVRIKISGCPNSCGQHHIADIGFFGAARSLYGKLVPHYQLLLGGRCRNGEAQFGQPVVKLPARRVPQAVALLLEYFRQTRQDGEAFAAFVARKGPAPFQALLVPLIAVQPPGDEPEAYRDWGATDDFALTGMGKGECAG